LTNGVSLLFTPYLLGKLGKSEYGLYVLVGSLVSYLGLLTFGMGGTLVRYIARYRAVGDKRSEENLLAMALMVYGVMSLLVFLTGCLIWSFLQDIFPKLSPDELIRVRQMFSLLVVSTSITLPSAVIVAVQTAYERFVFLRSVVIVSSLVRTAVLLALLYLGYKAVAIVIVDVAINVVVVLVNIVYVFGVMKIRIHLYHFNTQLFKEILIFTFWIFIHLIMDQLYWKFGQTILGITSGTATVAVFAIGIQMSYYFITLSNTISGVFLPRAAAMDAVNATNEEMTSMMILVGRFQFLVMGLALVGFVSLGRLFILNWLGVGYLSAWSIAIVIVIPLFLPLVQNFGISILQARNKHAAQSLIYVCIATVNVVIGYFLSRLYGGIGMAIGISLSLFMGQGIAINLYYHFKIGLNIPRFFKELSSGLLPGIVICSILSYLISLLPGINWGGVLYKGFIVTAIYMVTMWLCGTNAHEKAELRSLLKLTLGIISGQGIIKPNKIS
jgi:O-antigen/teichoic acid export membrane protein